MIIGKNQVKIQVNAHTRKNCVYIWSRTVADGADFRVPPGRGWGQLRTLGLPPAEAIESRWEGEEWYHDKKRIKIAA